MNARQPRLPIALQVAYRTSGAFLVAYSVNLSRGGIFLETKTPLPIGERISLQFEVPGVGIFEVAGVVAWIRQDDKADVPSGMGIQFDTLDKRYGDQIDSIVSRFSGLRVLSVATSRDRLSQLARYLRSIIACDVVEARVFQEIDAALQNKIDLAVVDLDAQPSVGLGAIGVIRQAHPTTPIILLAQDPGLRLQGRQAGADEALATPPSYRDLQASVIRLIAKPIRVGS